MTHLNHETNGASLEDCHTNFYALTDLCGIKWRKLVWGEFSYNPADLLDDPVLSSYSRCLMNDILCVWRRIGSQPQHSQQTPNVPNSASSGLFDSLSGLPTSMSAPPAPTLSLTTAKELWIFWYGEEPDLTGLVNPELLASDGEQGSWESGLSYECRSLLFKALHNLIERCLLSRDFVRLGKWFVQPYDGSKKLIESSSHLSISFSFFVHGESTVCISIDVRQHPPVRTLVKEHLEQTQSCSHSTPPLQVILAPFGLSGTLTGQSFKVADPQTQRLLEEWRNFYPVSFNNSSHSIEPAVEVVVAGIKLRYPSCYVFVTDLDESTANFYGTSSPPSKNSNQPVSGVPVTVVPLHQHHPESMAHPSSPATVLPERAWQDSVVSLPETPPVSPCPTPMQTGQDNQDSSFNLGHWSFHDPHRKCSCSCFKNTSNLRHQQQCASLQCQNSNLNSNSSSNNDNGGMLPLNTPPSIAPSPLANPNSSQPPSVPTLSDPTMPTLSPQHPGPPATPHEDKIPKTPSEFQGPKSASSVTNQVYSPYPSALSVDNSGSYNNVKMESANSRPNSVQPPSVLLQSQPTPQQSISTSESTMVAIKRPQLSYKEYETLVLEEESTLSNLLYDYSLMDAWLNHPVKKFKAAEPKIDPPTRGPTYSTMSSTSHSYSAVYNNTSTAHTFLPLSNDQFIKREPNNDHSSSVDITAPNNHINNIVRTKSDPYDFEDDNHNSAAIIPTDTYKNSPMEEDKPGFDQVTINGPESIPNSLFTNEGLATSYKDLDQIFENSDDSDGTGVQVQTPPGSNKSAGYTDDGTTYNNTTGTIMVKLPKGSGGNNTGGGLRAEELSKMFPTPPSMEHNPISSPGGGHLSDTPVSDPPDYLIPTLSTRIKQEICTSMGSPQNESIDDWSYVYRPPAYAQLVGSSKYAPITNLPSQIQSSIIMQPNCVYRPSFYYSQPTEKQQMLSNNGNVIVSSNSSGSNLTNINSHHPVGSPLRPSGSMMMHHHPPLQHSHQMLPSPHSHHLIIPPHNTMHHPGMHPRMGLSPISPGPYPPPSPLMNWQSYRPRTPCQPPPPYSPANSSPMYLNKNLNSVESIPNNNLGIVRSPEANSLMITVLLSDTLLNIFRDHNFDSCTLCVCNAGSKVVGNIRGADAATYLPQSVINAVPSMSPYPPYSPIPHHFVDEDSIRCNCGFSAVVNRRLSHRAGLFYEDEAEITGILDEPIEKDDLNGATINVIDLIREQCVIVHSSCNALYRAARQYKHPTPPATLNLLEFSDTNQVAVVALEQGRLAQIEAATVSVCKVEDMGSRQQQLMQQHCAGTAAINTRSPCVHRWPFMRAKGPRCNQDIMRVMKILQPLLQDAIQKKCSRLWDAPYTVTGPLTWRQFHRLAGRGTDDRCEPQPIPPVVVGHDKDWLSVSPYALHYWEKLLLEPYSYCRDVAYMVVSPDNEYILQRVRTFFKELSSSYEVSRLGRHCPITKILRDGILRVGKSAASKLAKESVDDWFNMLGESSTTSALRLYNQVCRHYLAPQLSQFTIDSSLLDPPESSNPRNVATSVDLLRPNSSPMPPPPSTTPDNVANSQNNCDKPPLTPKSEPQDDCNNRNDSSCSLSSSFLNDSGCHDEDDVHPPSVVIYLVEPFSVGSDDAELHRLACLALLRSYKNVLSSLPDNVRNSVIVQIISLESILELGRSGDRNRHSDEMRALALSIYSQCRRLLMHSSNVKALTGFGTAAMTDLFLKTKDEKNRAPYRAYCPPYILARNREKLRGSAENTDCGNGTGPSSALTDQQCSILFVSYCLSEDQRWILVTAVDEQGILLETATINVHIPNRSRRRKAPARRIGLQKVMDFILGVMSQSVTPWRLVVGRVGRLGHGELKGWSWLLSRKSLVKASKHLKEICGQCSLLYPTDVPCILSACLVSLEADSTLRVMPDQFTPDERFSQASVNCNLSTPHDVTCTHILVFPTSATTQSSQTAFQEQQNNGPDLGDDDLFSAIDDDMPEGMGDLNDIFSTWPETDAVGIRSPVGSPTGRGNSQAGSPSCNLGDLSGQRSPFPCNGGQLRNGMNGTDIQEEVGTLLQQPLALGYLVSTAPTGRMPRWFWSSCPHLENVCPVFLKSALHMHTMQQNTDELLHQSNVSGHPLDSQYTTDVLRYVLEGYNSLSWLAIDSNTHDRLSCLPVHMQVLMQLYHMMSALI